jgi:rod shape-determining protein MreD
MVLCGGATLIKAAVLFLLNRLFAGAVPAYSFFAPTLWVELMLNTLLAPFLFGFLKLFKSLLMGGN